MSDIFIFDVDGTLTPRGQAMTEEMHELMKEFVKRFPVYLVSEGSYQALGQQLPTDLPGHCKGVYCYSGCELWREGELVFALSYLFDHDLQLLCQHFVDASPYPHRHGDHIKTVPGSLKVSVVGNQANDIQRHHYLEWDKQTQGRLQLIDMIKLSRPEYDAVASEDASVTISPKGINKARILNDILTLHPDAPITFFGDAMSGNGNDQPLALALRKNSKIHNPLPVREWNNTLACLKEILAGNPASTAA